MSVKISSIIENQFPEFMRQESPLLVEFIKQYYISGEYPGASFDLISNLSNNSKLENLTRLVENTTLSADISFSDTDIFVESTDGFPDSYGLLKIDSEIITYTSKTKTSFVDCVRGFSGISNSQLEFSTSESDSHLNGAIVENLSILFLNKFLYKLKKQYIPGFEGREFDAKVNQNVFIEKSKDFYSIKGADKSFEILFGALYGEKVEVIKPRDYLFTPSAAEYRVSKDLVVEPIFGDPLLLENRTLFQDKTDQYPKASGSISKVEKIFRNNSDYYIISLDYDFNKDIDVAGSVFGEFSIHPKTRISKKVVAGSSAISVDSTVGFPSSGFLVLDDSSLIQYTSKSLTQFFDCSGILVDLEAGESVRVNAFAYGYSGSDKNNIVAVRVTGVIGDFEEIDNAYNLIAGDSIKPKTLGKSSTSVRSKNWVFNIPISYLVKSITLIDAVTSKYQIETFDDNIFYVGDSLNIVLTNGTIVPTDVYSKINFTNFIVQGQGAITLSTIDYIEKNISQVSASNFKNVEIYSANVQNVYEDSNENIFVASPSLPFYFQQPLEVSSRGIVLSGTFSGKIINYPNHGFLSGDVVLYDYPSVNNLGIPKGTYYVRKVDDDSLSLATSRSNLRAGIYLTVSGTVAGNTLEYNDFAGKTLTHQKLIRKIAQPSNRKVVEPTPVGNTGILLNGVEILNYKSQNSVYYGPVVSVDMVSPGDGYDVINPPVIEITDEQGSEAKVNPEIVGNLKEIRITNPNLIVIGEPTIVITGGNGTGAKAEPEVGLFDHSSLFSTRDISNNIIEFSACHNFFNYEKVLFKPNGRSYVTGITTDAEYYVSRISPNKVSLYKTYEDAVLNLSPLSLDVTGFGIHQLVSYEPKKKISSIRVTNPGQGYTNRRLSINSSEIDIKSGTINFPGHGFKTGELIIYDSYSQTPIVGIQTNISYYVTEVDENYFKLSQVANVGILTSKDFYLISQQYINFTSSGTGKHFFNYEPIKVTIDGVIDLCSSEQLPPTLAIVALNADQAEGNSGSKAFTFTVNRTGDTAGVSSAAWTVTGSGINPANAEDFSGSIFASGTVNFATGDASKTITVNINGDTTIESDEGFIVTLSNPSGATVATNVASGTIRNDDDQVCVDRPFFTIVGTVTVIPLDLEFQNEVYGYQINRDPGFNSTVQQVGIWADANVDHTVGIWSNTGLTPYNPQLIWQKQVRTTDPSYVSGGYRWYSVSDGPTIVGGITYTVATTWANHQIPAQMTSTDFSIIPNGEIGGNAAMPGTPNIFVPLLTDLSNPSYFPSENIGGDSLGYFSVNLIVRDCL
jgi:hypothetical protein